MSDKIKRFSVYYYVLIIFKVSLFVLFVFINTKTYSSTTKLRPDIDRFSDIVLMGQFNYINNNISTWSDTWSQFFKNIVIAAPQDTPKQELKLGNYMFYESDKGYFSPYVNMARVIKENEGIRGLLYVHDDLLISGSILRKIGGTEWILTDYDKSDNLIKVYQNGSFISNNRQIFSGHKYFRKAWPAWKQCHGNLTNMFDDQRITPYLSEPKSANPYLTARFGPSDMLYTFFSSTEHKNAYLEIMDMFTEHDLFLECAIPTAVSMMNERFGIKVHSAVLCTDWHNLRGNAKMIKKCVKEGRYEVFHPIKISQHRNWRNYFDYLIKL